MKYIWQHTSWPEPKWNETALNSLLIQCRQKQSYLLGSVNMLGFDLKLQTQGLILEKEVLGTSAIEGEKLDPSGVRSSVVPENLACLQAVCGALIGGLMLL